MSPSLRIPLGATVEGRACPDNAAGERVYTAASVLVTLLPVLAWLLTVPPALAGLVLLVALALV